jgi:L-rhamnose mutarotase
VHNFSCFGFGYRIFAYLEIRDEDEVYEVLDKVAQTPVKKKWDVKVMPWLKPKAAEGNDVQFLEIERIFYSP